LTGAFSRQLATGIAEGNTGLHNVKRFITNRLPYSAALLTMCLPGSASAHMVNTDVGEFYAGMMHPVTSPDHLLPMLALALLAGLHGKQAARMTLFVFPIALLAGMLAGGRLPGVAELQAMTLILLVAMGALLAFGQRLGAAAVGALTVIAGLLLGYRSGNDMAVSDVSAQFIPGVAVTGFVLMALVTSYVPTAFSLPGRSLRMAAGAGFVVIGVAMLLSSLGGLTTDTSQGLRLPSQEGLIAMVQDAQLTPSTVLAVIMAAAIWGAAHALTPGHGKAIVAAYLIGGRATPWHAAFLGLTVTVTHTLGVFALGLIALFASHYIVPEQLYPWLGVVSGLIVIGIGTAILWRSIRALPRGALASRDTHHEHHHSSHSHSHDHDHDHHHDSGHHHSHLPPGTDGRPVTWRSLLALGISGGLLPCPSALVLLLTAVSLNRTAFGIVLVLAFSVGLAAVLTVVGLLFVKGSRLLERMPVAGRWTQAVPMVSALVICLIGMGVTAGALAEIRL
jgi:nickel/cobalt exporter